MTAPGPRFGRGRAFADWTAAGARWLLRTSRLDGAVDAVVRRPLARAQSGSMWPAAAGLGCCSVGLLSVMGPRWDPERLGLPFVDEPEGCDVLLVDGPLTRASRAQLPRLIARMEEPRWVVAVGSCAVGGGAFRGGYAVLGGIDQEVRVDVHVPGCPPTPEAVLLGLIKLGELVRRDARDFVVVSPGEGGLL